MDNKEKLDNFSSILKSIEKEKSKISDCEMVINLIQSGESNDSYDIFASRKNFACNSYKNFRISSRGDRYLTLLGLHWGDGEEAIIDEAVIKVWKNRLEKAQQKLDELLVELKETVNKE